MKIVSRERPPSPEKAIKRAQKLHAGGARARIAKIKGDKNARILYRYTI